MFLLNLAVTSLCFSNAAPQTDQYRFLVPDAGSFAEGLYNVSPVLMEVFYCFFNAFTIALLSIFVLGIHMCVPTRRVFSAILVPFLVLCALNCAEGLLFANSPQYNISVIMQPRAAAALSQSVTWTHVGLALGAIFLADVLILLLGYFRNWDVL